MSVPLLGPMHTLPPPAPDCPIRVVATRIAVARPADATVRYVSGWGATVEDAVLGCRHEAAERYCAQFHDADRPTRARRGELAGAAVPPPETLLIADWQFADRDQWNADHPGFNELPYPWQPEAEIDWVASDPALGSAVKWLPAGLCYLGHARDRAAGLPPADSNGLAAGRTLEDAVVRAFLELVERDAVAIWWYNRIPRPRLDPAGLGEPLTSSYATWSLDRGRQLRLHDITHDLGLPVIAAVAHDGDGAHIALGFGAGISAAEAARRAVGELAQFEANVALLEAAAARQGPPPAGEAQALLAWWRIDRLAAHPHLQGIDGAVNAMTAAPPPFPPLDLAHCHALCSDRGLDFLAVDLSRTGIAESVVRVVVPGLRPLWARFAPGRLYDVPVRLGWRRDAITADALNPTPIMF